MPPSKVYYIANARMPTERAHGIQLAKMCEAFLHEGMNFELVVPHRRTTNQSLRDFYGLDADIPIKKLPVPDWYASGRFGFFIASLSFAVSYFFYLLSKKMHGEHVIVYMMDTDQFSFFLIPFLRVPYFCEIHDAKKNMLLLRVLFRSSRGIITINRIIKKELMRVFGIAEHRVLIQPNGIDLKNYAGLPFRDEARKLLNLPLDKRIVLYAGKFYDWKGLDILLGVSSLLKGDVMLTLVGGTKEELRIAVKAASISSAITCVGPRDFKEIPLWLASADLLLVLGTKRNEYSYLHTSPMKFFEYMASRRPIVASHTPANGEIVSTSEVLFYEPDKPHDLADKIMYALSHKEEMAERVERAYQKVLPLTWEMRARTIIRFMAKNI